MWDTQHNNAIRIVSGLWFCRRSWRLKINIRETVVHIRKSHVCSNELGSNFLSHTVQRKLKLFLLMQVYAWMENQLLIFWDLFIEVFHSSPNQSKKTKDQVRGESSRNTTSNKSTPKTKPRFQFITTIWNWVMLMMCRRTRSLLNSVRCSTFFEDNEAVIKMIIKGRSPIMRHVSRTHRVALDWLFDRSNLDPKTQVKYVDTKHQWWVEQYSPFV